MADEDQKSNNDQIDKKQLVSKKIKENDNTSSIQTQKLEEVSSKINKENISEFFRKYLRVLKLARRPTRDEFFKISVVSAIGIAIIGVIGFIIYLTFYYIVP